MFTRILTGILLGPLVLLLVLKGPWWGILILIAAAAGIAADEAARILLSELGARLSDRLVAVVLVVGVVVSAYSFGSSGLALGIAIAAMLAMASVLAVLGDIELAGRRASAMLAAILYVGALMGCLAMTVHLGGDTGRYAIVLAFFTVWLGDTVAYFSGRAIGGPKLYPAVSPKKTWAGAIGGLVGSALGGVLGWWWFFPAHSPGWFVALGCGVGVVEQLGDLCESLLKRSFGVKDSGTVLPGHGGMLDRIDGLLFGAPVVYLFVYILVR